MAQSAGSVGLQRLRTPHDRLPAGAAVGGAVPALSISNPLQQQPSPRRYYEDTVLDATALMDTTTLTVNRQPHDTPQPSTKQSKAPSFQDPMSALAAHLKGAKLDVKFSSVGSGPGCNLFEAQLVLDGITFKATGAGKKEAKQKLAVIVLRDQFSVDATELLEHYLTNQSAPPHHKKPRMATAGTGGMQYSYGDVISANPPATGLFQTVRLGGQSAAEAEARMRAVDVAQLLAENRRLRMEVESLKEQLAAAQTAPGLKSQKNAGGVPASVEDWELKLANQTPPSAAEEVREETAKELTGFLQEHKLGNFKFVKTDWVSQQAGSQAAAAHYAMLQLSRGKEVFYGRGQTSKQAKLMAQAVALSYLRRVQAGEKLVPPNKEPLTFFNNLIVSLAKPQPGGHKPPAIKLQPTPDNQFNASFTWEGVSVNAVRPSRKQAKLAAATEALTHIFSYSFY